jgi:hypothetical protein
VGQIPPSSTARLWTLKVLWNPRSASCHQTVFSGRETCHFLWHGMIRCYYTTELTNISAGTMSLMNKMDFRYLPLCMQMRWPASHLSYWGKSLTTAIPNLGWHFLRLPKAILAGKPWLIRHCSCFESPAYATCLTMSPHGLRTWHNGQVKGLRFFFGIAALLSLNAKLLPECTSYFCEYQ